MSFGPNDILPCFNSSYDQAREAFLTECRHQNLTVAQHLLPDRSGVSGEPLYTDIATLGNTESDTVLIVSSGVHGVEGYAGSALQIGLLRSGILRALPLGCVAYVVHAINPFGFSYRRRVNEDNIDLNRNFIDFDRAIPNSPDFDEFQSFVSAGLESGMCNDLLQAASRYRALYGESKYQRALTMGQYTEPTGVYYGGDRLTWSNRTWRKLLDGVLPGKTRAFHIDIHTGLGDHGEETLIYTRDVERAGFRLACDCFGSDELLIPGKNVTPNLNGPIPSSFAKFENKMCVIGVAPEYGTVPLTTMLSTLLEENELWQSGRQNETEYLDVLERMMKCFCPADDGWRTRVWTQFYRRIEQTVSYLDNQ